VIRVVSTIRPCIFRSPTTGRLSLAGGTVISVNGRPVLPGIAYPEVPESTMPSDIVWSRPEPRYEPKPAVKSFEVEGRTGTYTVTVDGRRVTCTCPGYSFRKTCKHVTQVLKTGA
jgi:hypothetical protein